jgi:hypothetical protein
MEETTDLNSCSSMAFKLASRRLEQSLAEYGITLSASQLFKHESLFLESIIDFAEERKDLSLLRCAIDAYQPVGKNLVHEAAYVQGWSVEPDTFDGEVIYARGCTIKNWRPLSNEAQTKALLEPEGIVCTSLADGIWSAQHAEGAWATGSTSAEAGLRCFVKVYLLREHGLELKTNPTAPEAWQPLGI